MKPFKLMVTIAVVLLSLQSIAQKDNNQSDHTQFKRLYIGDTVPMESIVFNNVRNYPGRKAKLSDFKGKYIILDFWTKGCSSCIAAFPHMEELQRQFNDDIQILLVTKNSEEDLALLSKNSPNLKNTKLPVVIGDQILATQLFPHGTVPYHVWLDKEGKVLATTYAQETNSKNLQDLVAGGKPHLFVKDEVFDEGVIKEVENQKISLLKVGNGRFLEYLKYYAQIPIAKIGNKAPELNSSVPNLPYYSMFMSYIPGEMMEGYSGLVGRVLLTHDGIETGLRITNYTINDLYAIAYNSRVDIKIVIEGMAKKFYEEITDTTNMQRYVINNKYCYESCLPEYTLGDAKKILQLDLARFFGMTGSLEDRPIKHLILTRLRIKEEERLWMGDQNVSYELYKNGISEKGDYVIKNLTFSGLVGALTEANSASEHPIVIDETGFDNDVKYYKKIDVLLKCKDLVATPENISLMRKELAKYGLGLKEEIRTIQVLVLKPVL